MTVSRRAIRLTTLGAVVGIVMMVGGALRERSQQNETATLSTTVTIEGGDLFEPPPDGFSPAISADQALRMARNELSGQPPSITARLASYTNGAIDGVPVWVVTMDGVCLPSFNPSADISKCSFTSASVVIDATTGRFMESVNTTYDPFSQSADD